MKFKSKEQIDIRLKTREKFNDSQPHPHPPPPRQKKIVPQKSATQQIVAHNSSSVATAIQSQCAAELVILYKFRLNA